MKRNLFRFGMAVAACALGMMVFAACEKDNNNDSKSKENDPQKYTITLTADGGGSARATVSGATITQAKAGDVVTITLTPASGYKFQEWTAVSGDAPIDNPIVNPTTFTMPASDVNIRAKALQEFNVSNEQEWNAARSAIANGGNDREYVININADFSAAGSLVNTFGNATDIQVSILGEHTISLNELGGLIWVGTGQTVIIQCGIMGFDGNYVSLVNIYSGGKLYLKEGGKLSGNMGSILGGGVHVHNGAFTMSGGTISGNHTTYTYGGAVYVSGDGEFTMTGGEIRGNSVRGQGGGVYIQASTFIMSGGKISENTSLPDNSISDISYGGGVYLFGNISIFTMSGGEISGNIVGHYGGGVYARYGTITMSGGEISGNTAGKGGGGVYVSSGTFIMSDGKISGNSAREGGGVYFSSSFDSQFRKTANSVIYGKNENEKSNTATADTNGHAVYFYSYGKTKYRDVTAGAGVNITVTDGTAGEGFEN